MARRACPSRALPQAYDCLGTASAPFRPKALSAIVVADANQRYATADRVLRSDEGRCCSCSDPKDEQQGRVLWDVPMPRPADVVVSTPLARASTWCETMPA